MAVTEELELSALFILSPLLLNECSSFFSLTNSGISWCLFYRSIILYAIDHYSIIVQVEDYGVFLDLLVTVPVV